jgi:opacity protein-like surface antigen
MKTIIAAAVATLVATSVSAADIYEDLGRGNLDLAPHGVEYAGVTAMQPGIGSEIDRFQGFDVGKPDVTHSTETDGTVTASTSMQDQVIYVGPGSVF